MNGYPFGQMPNMPQFQKMSVPLHGAVKKNMRLAFKSARVRLWFGVSLAVVGLCFIGIVAVAGQSAIVPLYLAGAGIATVGFILAALCIYPYFSGKYICQVMDQIVGQDYVLIEKLQVPNGPEIVNKELLVRALIDKGNLPNYEIFGRFVTKHGLQPKEEVDLSKLPKRCPNCGAPVGEITCPYCGFRFY